MTRTTSLPAAVLLGVSMLVPTTAHAAGETCQGQPATIVGQPDQLDLLGTEGPDVIVSNGAFEVQAQGGDDLVCVTGDGYTTVRAGAGNDVVDASSVMEDSDGVFAVLGAGDDTYTGSAADDEVVTGADTETDADADVVQTRTGRYDLVYSGQIRLANPDRIEGDGLEVWWRGTPTAAGLADGGHRGTFRWYRPRGVSRLKIDAAAGTLSADVGTTLQLRGFTSFAVDRDRRLRTVVYRGSDRDETLRTWGSSPTTAFRIALGGGDDWVSVGDVATGTRLSGGDGTDRLLVGSRSRIGLSLSKERMTLGAGGTGTTSDANSFESATVTSPDVLLTGTGAANDLVVNACRATVWGLVGSDSITARRGTRDVGPVSCQVASRMHLHGDAGNDVILGSRGPDRLLGGPGRDTVDGERDRDVCQGEKLRRCEVRR